MSNATRPDVGQLVSGGQTRRRRRNQLRGAGAAVAAVLIAVAAYTVTHRDVGDADGSRVAGDPLTSDLAAPSTTPPSLPSEPGNETIEPGTFRMLVGFDSTGARIDADLTFQTRDWEDGNFPIVEVGAFVGGVGAYQPEGLAAGTGCLADKLNTDLAGADLVQLLADLPRSKVLRPVTQVRAFGHDASHVRVRITDDCPIDQSYRVAETLRGGRGISYSPVPTTVTADFWVVDLGNADVVVDAWHQDGSSADLVNQVADVRDSITFVIGE